MNPKSERRMLHEAPGERLHFFLAPITDNTECSQSSYIASMHLTNAPVSIKSLCRNGSQEIDSHGLVFSHPKEDATGFVVSRFLTEFLVVHSDIVSWDLIKGDRRAGCLSLALRCH